MRNLLHLLGPLILLTVFAGFAYCEESDHSGVGCKIEAFFHKKEKRWMVHGHWKAPNVEKQSVLLGAKFKTFLSASRRCDKWMKEKSKLMPVNIRKEKKGEEP